MASRSTTAALAGLAMTAGLALAADQKIKQSDVPAPALKAIQAAYPGATLTSFEKEDEDGRTVYEVGVDRGGRKMDVIVSPEGTIVLEEALVDFKDLPPAVQSGFTGSSYGKLKVTKAEKLTRPGATQPPDYEIVVQDGARKHELMFTVDGQLKKT